MTNRTRDTGVDETREHPVHDDHYDERQAEAPRDARGDQVNVNAGGGGRTYVEEGPTPLAYARRIIGLLFGIFISLIALRILLLALGANEGNAIVDGIYGITEPLVAPFRGMFSMDEVRPTGNSVFDIAALVAIVAWSLIALLIIAVLRLPERS